MNTRLVCPNCQHEFSKQLTGFNRTATCPRCHVESYMLLAVEPVEYSPPSWNVSKPAQFDVVCDLPLGINYTIKEI